MASLRRNIAISALFTLFGGPAFILGYFPYTLIRFRIPPNQPAWRLIAAILLIAAGLAPLFESIVRFIIVGRGTLVPTTPTVHLVVSGLYRYVRNPMYVGVTLSLIGEALLFRSDGLLIFLAAGCLAMHLFVCLYEEPALTRQFPADYPAYRNCVPRWLPRLTPWRELSE
jgi:protein-S-isoprenylcysteine O-methyltransferase Ste14